MGKFLRKAAVASAVALAFSGTAFAQATLTNGSITASLDASGNFDSSTGSGAAGLNFMGTEYVNWGAFVSWYWLTSDSPATTALATSGSNPLGAVTSPAGSFAATTFSTGGLSVSMLHVLTDATTMVTTVTISNPTGGAYGDVSGVRWSVGLDPDQGIPGGSGFDTTNVITGVGGNARVTAFSSTAAPISIGNTTGAGAYAVEAAVLSSYGLGPVDGATVLGINQAYGYSLYADVGIALGYDLGTIKDGKDVSFGYSYSFANPVPEPETYAMLLAGLGLMGFVARRRQRKLAAA